MSWVSCYSGLLSGWRTRNRGYALMELSLYGKLCWVELHRTPFWDQYCFSFTLMIYIKEFGTGYWNLQMIPKFSVKSVQHPSIRNCSRILIHCSTGPKSGKCCSLFNVEKYNVMHFGHNNRQLNYTLDSKMLQKVHEEKDLGIVVSDDLKASLQCTQTYNKANSMLGVINRCIVYKTKDILLCLYKSLVCPHLEYCTAAWNPHYIKDKELLERVQQRFTRMISELRNLPYADHLRHMNLQSLEERWVRADLVEVYKIIHGLSAIAFESFFEFNKSGHTRGHSLKLRKQRCRLDLRLHLIHRKSDKLVEQSRWSNCLSIIVELFQKKAYKAEKQRDRSLHGQVCL